MSVEIMAVSAIKAQVIRVEGFDLQVTGKRKLAVSLHDKKQSADDMTVSVWINDNFPGIEKGVVSVLFANGRQVKRVNQVQLKKVRGGYPPALILGAKDRAKAEKITAETREQLKENKKTLRQVKGEHRKTVQQTAQKINAAQRNAELGAAFEAIDKALRKPNSYHQRVKELCKKSISDGLHDTQVLIERMLAAWSHAEKEKDRLGLPNLVTVPLT